MGIAVVGTAGLGEAGCKAELTSASERVVGSRVWLAVAKPQSPPKLGTTMW